jgi:hypothetical protein
MGSSMYSWEKCYTAVIALASGAGGLRERLSNAWWHHLHLLGAHPIPWPDLREKFEKIGERLVPEISSAPEDSAKMQEDDLRSIAREIVELYDTVCARHATEHTVAKANP